eukprot:768360-Hanusia_phi.AAC.5
MFGRIGAYGHDTPAGLGTLARARPGPAARTGTVRRKARRGSGRLRREPRETLRGSDWQLIPKFSYYDPMIRSDSIRAESTLYGRTVSDLYYQVRGR